MSQLVLLAVSVCLLECDSSVFGLGLGRRPQRVLVGMDLCDQSPVLIGHECVRAPRWQ